MNWPTPWRVLAAIVTSVTALVLPSTSSAATPDRAISSQEVIALLNQQRAAHGIPADITERPEWSDGCAKHNLYMEHNNELTHQEDPSKSGYTAEGAKAGQSSVLGGRYDYGDDRSPFENAPIHLAQTLAPELQETGANYLHSVCMWTAPGYTRPAGSPQIYTYPGDGATAVWPDQFAGEHPFTPGDFVGLSRTWTGPHLLVYGPWRNGEYGATGSARVAAMSLDGPDGPVELRSVDNVTKTVGSYLPPSSAIVIPATPLRARATYTARVRLTVYRGNDVTEVERTWSFTTGDLRRQFPQPSNAPSSTMPRTPKLRFVSVKRKGRTLTVAVKIVSGAGKLTLRAAQLASKTRARVTTRVDGKPLKAKGVVQRFRLKLPSKGRWRLKAILDGESGWRDRTTTRIVSLPR